MKRESVGGDVAGEVADYLIVGAGSAGSVLAHRLSRDPAKRVVLFESGPRDRSLLLHIPRGYGKLLGSGSSLLWQFPVRSPHGTNQPEYQLRGRVLGGTSAINGMMYMRGQSGDYDAWNIPGWEWRELGRCFREMEHHELGASDVRGGDGPLRISAGRYDLPLCDAAIEAAAGVGIPATEDINARDGAGIGYQPRTIWKGWRQSAAKAFLDPIRGRRNLTIETDATIERILFEGRRAVGVRFRQGGAVRELRAREVILSAGALSSPKLLLLSGIGPAARLRSLGIDVVADRAAVGANLSDHRILMMRYDTNGGSDNREFSGWRLWRNVMRQFLFGTGPLSRAGFEVGGYAQVLPESNGPDVQLLMAPFYSLLTETGFEMGGTPGGTAGFYQTRPQSRGTLTLASTDPQAPPDVDPNALSHERDCRVALGGFALIRKWFAQAPLARFAPVETSPGPDIASDDDLIDFMRRASASAQHVSGTCRMGTDEGSVVDPMLRVRGVEGLRVMDISVMPSPTSGNTNGPAMAMAWRAAELIAATPN